MTPGITAVPEHVGIIMDGNGRWAKERGLSRSSGHKEGLEAAKRIVAHASERGIRYLSLYTFSTENWKRSEEEVNFLLGLIRSQLRKQYDFYQKNNIRIIHSGDIQRLPKAVRYEISLAEQETVGFNGLLVNLLINYGGRDEILRSIKRFTAHGGDIQFMTEQDISAHMDNPGLPEIDLIIRSGGEKRLSNFMLWQAAYAEIYFTNNYWPDWSTDDLDKALVYFQSCHRRFGGH